MRTCLPRRSLCARSLITGALACATALGTLSTPSAWASAPKPAEMAPALLAKIKLHGKVVARLTIGTQVQVTGHVVNTDTKRHDAFLAATLYDAHGHVVGRAKGLADDLMPRKLYPYKLIGAALAPHWTKVVVKVTRVTENVAGEGVD